MKLSQIVCKSNKIMVNVIKFNMTSFFHNSGKKIIFSNFVNFGALYFLSETFVGF